MRDPRKALKRWYTPFSALEGTPEEVRQWIEGEVRLTIQNNLAGKGLVYMLPTRGHHVKAYEIMVTVRLKRDPVHDYLENHQDVVEEEQ